MINYLLSLLGFKLLSREETIQKMEARLEALGLEIEFENDPQHRNLLCREFINLKRECNAMKSKSIPK